VGIILCLVLVSADPSSHCYKVIRLCVSPLPVVYCILISIGRAQAVYMNHDTNAVGEQKMHERQKRK